MSQGCLCCEKGLPTTDPRICPVCDRVFQGNGWDGIDAHWHANHLDVMPYEEFWSSLCAGHGGRVATRRAQSSLKAIADMDREGTVGNKKLYREYMKASNADGSNKASSYIRAIELLDPILESKGGTFADCHNVYAIGSVQRVSELYEFVLEQQRLAEKGMFGGEEPVSYWRDRYCSAALKSYREFLVLNPYRNKLWDAYNQDDVDPAVLGQQIDAAEAPDLKELVEEKDVDFSTKEGKEKVRQVKARVNQSFFREMILRDYSSQCCVSGLNVPGILRASHIVGWAEDKKNRLNPANGLCLSATYDAAFDRHLISFDEDCRMILSGELKEHYTNDAFKSQFLEMEGREISMPSRFHPDQRFLERHREKMK